MTTSQESAVRGVPPQLTPQLADELLASAMDTSTVAATPQVRRRHAWRPGFAPLLVAYPFFLAVAWWTWVRHSGLSLIGCVTTAVWTLPIINTVVGLSGGMLAAGHLRRSKRLPPTPAIARNLLIIVVPTIGRLDTYPALDRAVRSFCRHMPEYFPNMRVDVVVEEDCDALDQIMQLAAMNRSVRIVRVPRSYRPPNGTRFKARANHYVHELRSAEGEARDDVWVLHMDDDTGVGPDTVESLARFVNAQWLAGERGRHLAQGVLSYPREHSANRLLWLADAVRPGCDISLFAATTGRGMPRAGLHGELLMIRASVEEGIGWDFGPRSIVEDAEFALKFCDLHPRRSDWFPGFSYGASPATMGDFVRQRERWAWGLLELAVKRSIPLRHRLLLLHNVAIWAFAPIQHLAMITLVGALLGDTDTSPATYLVLPLWALNMSFSIWQYWEGLKINTSVSARPGRRWWEPICLVLLIPIFSLIEAAGVFRGMVRFMRGGESSFAVITKPI